MSNRELYKATFSQVHTEAKIEMEDFTMKKPVHRIKKRMLVLAAVICLAIAGSVTALAANLFGLKNLVLSSGGSTPIQTGDSGTIPVYDDSGAIDDELPVPTPMDLISLQGYSDSNEYKAAVEWNDFCESYDQDGSLLAQVGNGPTGLDEKYNLYLVYTQEMADKLDEIVTKYGLKLHRTLDILDKDAFFERVGRGKFLGSGNTTYGGYIYEDGTFHMEGFAMIKDIVMYYQMMNCMKGSFTDVFLNVGDVNAYREWTYTTTSGVTVSLCMGLTKCLVIADLGDSFLTVNVLCGTQDEGVTAADLEAFANTFDFSALK